MKSVSPPSGSDVSGDDVLSRARTGDPAALNELLTLHYERIWSVCRRVTGNHADAEDATQEALIKIARALPGFDGRSQFSTWAYRIATNCAIDAIRKRGRRNELSADRPIGDGEHTIASTLEDKPEAEAIEQLPAMMAFEAALAHLDEDFRVAVVMRDVATLSYGEIAQHLGVPTGTVKSRIARGRQQLFEILSEGNQSGPDDVESDKSGKSNR